MPNQPPPPPQHEYSCITSLLVISLNRGRCLSGCLPQVELRDLFRNQDATEFCIVTISTQLAIAESKRLLAALSTQGIAVRNVVVNQVRSPRNGSLCVYIQSPSYYFGGVLWVLLTHGRWASTC